METNIDIITNDLITIIQNKLEIDRLNKQIKDLDKRNRDIVKVIVRDTKSLEHFVACNEGLFYLKIRNIIGSFDIENINLDFCHVDIVKASVVFTNKV